MTSTAIDIHYAKESLLRDTFAVWNGMNRGQSLEWLGRVTGKKNLKSSVWQQKRGIPISPHSVQFRGGDTRMDPEVPKGSQKYNGL